MSIEYVIKSSFDHLADTIESKMSDFSSRLNALERSTIESRKPGIKSKVSDPEFLNYLKNGKIETKALTLWSGTAGYKAPIEFSNRLIEYLFNYSPIRSVANVRTSAANTLRIPKMTTAPVAAWATETGTRNVDTSIEVGQVDIQSFEMSYLTKATLQMLEDQNFNLEDELAKSFAGSFAVLEGTAFISGDGTTQPEGLLTNASVPVALTGDASKLTADSLISLPYKINFAYRANPKECYWLMNGKTIGTIRQLKDPVTGVYLWQPGLSVDSPQTLLGYPILECPNMPDIAANNFPILFGNIKRAYTILDHVDFMVLRLSELFIQNGYIGFMGRKRVGGAVVDANAIVKLKVAAS